MNLIILNKTTKEEIINDKLIVETVLGDSTDTSNCVEDMDSEAWDSTKTDYQIGKVVHHAGFYFEYTCLTQNTREVPRIGSSDWIKSGTRSQYRYRDNAPTRESFRAKNEVIEIVLNLTLATDYLFIQHLRNIKHIKVEGLNLAGDIIKTIVDRDTEMILTFQKYNCCSITYTQDTFFTSDIDGCTSFQKIKITLTPVTDKIGLVGSACVGKKLDIGCLQEYPTLTPKSTAKFEMANIDFNLNNGAKYIDSKVTTWMSRGRENEVDLVLIKNVGSLVGFDINEFPEKNITKFLGFYKQSPITIDGEYQKITLDLYGIPNER